MTAVCACASFVNCSASTNRLHRYGPLLSAPPIVSSSSSLVFSPKAGFGRNQSPVRRPVWLWHTAFQALSQGQVAIAFPRLQTFPLSPLGASTCRRHERLLSAKDGITGEKWSVNFACDFDFHVNPGFFVMPRKSATWETAWEGMGGEGGKPYHLHVPIVLKSGSFNLLVPSGPVQRLLYLQISMRCR